MRGRLFGTFASLAKTKKLRGPQRWPRCTGNWNDLCSISEPIHMVIVHGIKKHESVVPQVATSPHLPGPFPCCRVLLTFRQHSEQQRQIPTSRVETKTLRLSKNNREQPWSRQVEQNHPRVAPGGNWLFTDHIKLLFFLLFFTVWDLCLTFILMNHASFQK